VCGPVPRVPGIWSRLHSRERIGSVH
jgi:hypothetical protein